RGARGALRRVSILADPHGRRHEASWAGGSARTGGFVDRVDRRGDCVLGWIQRGLDIDERTRICCAKHTKQTQRWSNDIFVDWHGEFVEPHSAGTSIWTS